MKLISDEYLAEQRMLHKAGNYGRSGHKHVEAVLDFAQSLNASDILDYGAGQGTLRAALCAICSSKKRTGRCTHERPHGFEFREYDPAIPEIAAKPSRADLVVATDVLEHIEPACMSDVLEHIASLSRRGFFAVIALRPAEKTLSDGRNAHISLNPPEWWKEELERVFAFRGFYLEKPPAGRSSKELLIYARRYANRTVR